MPTVVLPLITPLRRAVRPLCRVVVFPHAGAGPQSYCSLAGHLPERVEVVRVALPGRGHGPVSPTAAQMRLPSEVGRELAALRRLPTVFVGHSMGALLAAVTAHARPTVCGALVASAGLPGTHGWPERARPGTREGLIALLGRHRLPPTALERADLLTPEQRFLVHDLALAQRLLLRMADVRLGVPLTALAGQDDRLVPAGTVPGWQRFTSGPFRCGTVPGGHWFPFVPVGRRRLLAEIGWAMAAAGAQASSAPVEP